MSLYYIHVANIFDTFQIRNDACNHVEPHGKEDIVPCSKLQTDCHQNFHARYMRG